MGWGTLKEVIDRTFRSCNKLLNSSNLSLRDETKSNCCLLYVRADSFYWKERKTPVKSPWVYSFVMSGMSWMQRPPLVNSLACRRKFRYSRVDVKATRLQPPHQQSAQRRFSSKASSKLQTPTWMPSSRPGEPSSGARVWPNSPGLQEDTEVREMKETVDLLGSELTLGFSWVHFTLITTMTCSETSSEQR